LVEDELKQIDTRKVIRSSKMILGKLSIFNNAFEDFDMALKDKRTEINTFPFNLICTYTIEKINHSKSEVRKLDREIIIKMYKIFGFKKLEPHLKKVDERELEKLVILIPEVKEIIQNLKMNPKGSENSIIREKSPKERPKGRSTSKDKKGNSSSKQINSKNSNKSLSPPKKMLICKHCGKTEKTMLTEEDLLEHVNKNCLMFINCVKCKINLEVKNYNNHLLNECENKSEFKLCKRCKEAIDNKEYDQHVKENKCVPAKNPNSSGRCPLCHKDIPPQEKGFVKHLTKDTCPKHVRKEKK
jgi:centrosomal protein CEP104